jgi:hypothetical protein
MRTHLAVSFIVLSLVSGGAGYMLRAQKTDGSLVLSAKDVIQGDYLAPPDCYSRVKNTINSLDGLCTRIRLGIQESAVVYDKLVRHGGAPSAQAALVLERATREAETALRDFEGTDQQLYILQDLLHLLERAGQFDRWNQLYVGAVYEHPTHPVVSRLARQAISISKQVGEQKQVLDALRSLATLPGEFGCKDQVEATLTAESGCFAQLEFKPESRTGHSLGDQESIR